MSDDHTQELKAFIFDQLRAQGFDSTNKDLDYLLFQTPVSLRLRKEGFLILRKLYDVEDFPLDKPLTGRELMTLKWHVRWPYFLPQNHSHLAIFSTVKDTFVLKLRGGDVKKWLAGVYQKSLNKSKT
jgi:hypothetical protein